MKVSTSQPFQIIYSLFQHEYLGFLFESFVVQKDDNGRLMFQHQNISSKNAAEFGEGLDDNDYELIRIMDSMQQDVVVKRFSKKKIKTADFFLKVYDKEKGNELIQQEIDAYLENRRHKILDLLLGKMLFEMSNDGEPAWKQIEVLEEKATVLFHFMRNEENTHYFPTIKYAGQKVDFQYKGAYLVCRHPAWLVVDHKLYSFKKQVDGNKFKPFLNKKFILIPKKVEDTYYRKFVAPLVESFDVNAKGFSINSESYDPIPLITFSELSGNGNGNGTSNLFEPENGNGNDNSNGNGKVAVEDSGNILFKLFFKYGRYEFPADKLNPTSVSVEKKEDDYIFHKINRKPSQEKKVLKLLEANGLVFKNARSTVPKPSAFTWINLNRTEFEKLGYIFQQNPKDDKRYFLGKSSISIEVRENIDWFDIHAIVKFGEYEIPFAEIRKLMLRKKREVELPNGETAVIPEVWFTEYSELFAFMDDDKEKTGALMLKKHHIALINDLENGNLAKVTISKKLEKLKHFDRIDEAEMPAHFKGTLRPYQKAGYNWLNFLNSYRLGGCLADDMGLGKTVQTLALLQAEKEKGAENATLLVMPTSLIYNWEMEAKKFTPKLKVFIYTGTSRVKDTTQFTKYDLILTSYGIIRLDVEILKKYYFNYIILDESQAIKNPSSNIAKAVKTLQSRHRLILSGTPLENSTMDLWSQMTFVNPGLLGTQGFFKKEFLQPIEKRHDESKTSKLYTIIKPFLLRRQKSQVATELPKKIENVHYCKMTDLQEEKYEEAKSYYRNIILDRIESHGVSNSQFLLLQGLTKLRQIANHPKMIDPEYAGDSGKLEDVVRMLSNAIGENHKILIFSQFVKHLSILKNYLQRNEIRFAYLDGSTKNRQEQVNNFQNDPKIRVFLISLKAGGLGLNLTKADYVFLLDPWWNPAIEAQAVDRAHRIGQENTVFTYKFISKNTVEEKILALQKNKIKLASELITTEESFVKNLSKEDISNLLG